MKKSKAWWSKVSRKKKVLIYCIGIVISVFLLYVVKGAPTDFENEFRRAEKANLVGPGNILGSISVYGGSHDAYNRMLVAEDEEGLILYPYHLGSGATGICAIWKRRETSPFSQNPRNWHTTGKTWKSFL